jgi:hypothetical protein
VTPLEIQRAAAHEFRTARIASAAAAARVCRCDGAAAQIAPDSASTSYIVVTGVHGAVA